MHELSEEQLKLRTVVKIDIANDPIPSADYKQAEDPAKFRSVKSGRGPLTGNWIERVGFFTFFYLVEFQVSYEACMNDV